LVSEQDAHVLDGGDQVILDLLAPEPSPPRPFEVMIVGGIGKALLHQLLAALAIAPRTGVVPSNGVASKGPWGDAYRAYERNLRECRFDPSPRTESHSTQGPSDEGEDF
jgi:hypothetical protein